MGSVLVMFVTLYLAHTSAAAVASSTSPPYFGDQDSQEVGEGELNLTIPVATTRMISALGWATMRAGRVFVIEECCLPFVLYVCHLHVMCAITMPRLFLLLQQRQVLSVRVLEETEFPTGC